LLDFRVGRAGNEFVAEWPGLCSVRMSRSGAVRSFLPNEGVDENKAKRLLDGPVRALTRHFSGKISLHASAAARDGAAVVFLGASTCGKSTFAAHLCRSGFEMLADDAAFLEERPDGFYVVPSESMHWLREDAGRLLGAVDSQTDKFQLAPAVVARGPVRLRLIVGLKFDESSPQAALRRLQGHEAFRWLRTSLFRVVIDEPEVDASDFANVASLYAGAELFELRRRQCLGELHQGAELLLAALDRLNLTGPTR
jgi:serine kinase of HPr protein (carbohydrate metabolism regulator)